MKKNHGGKRKGAGAKKLPVSELKVNVGLNVKNSTIDMLGGKKALRSDLNEHINYRVMEKKIMNLENLLQKVVTAIDLEPLNLKHKADFKRLNNEIEQLNYELLKTK